MTQDVQLEWQVWDDAPEAAPVDVAIDATVGEAVPRRLQWAMDHCTPLVIGTTGWMPTEALEQAAASVGVLVAPNFSITVALVARFAAVLGRYARLQPDRDLYLVEHHHRAKVDAPSGTARRLLKAMGAADRTAIAVLRAGVNVGRHTVGFDSPAESLEIQHQAHSRRLFAEGALEAARYLRDRKGLHTMDDLAAAILDPLFEQE